MVGAPAPLPAALHAQADRRVVRITLLCVAAALAVLAGLLLGGGYLVRTRLLGAYAVQSESMLPTIVRGQAVVVNKQAYRNGALPRRGDIVVFNAPPQATDGEPGVQFIHRVVALPGDNVEVRGARLSLGEQDIAGGDAGWSVHDWLRFHVGAGEDETVRVFSDHVAAGAQTWDTKQIAALAAAEASQMPERNGRLVLVPGVLLVNGRPQTEPFTREDPGYDYGPVRLGPGQILVLGDNRNRARDGHIWGPLDSQRLIGRVVVP